MVEKYKLQENASILALDAESSNEHTIPDGDIQKVISYARVDLEL